MYGSEGRVRWQHRILTRLKTHIGVDRKSKMIHLVVATAANVHDSHILDDLFHGDETRVWGDSAYASQKEVLRSCAPKVKDFIQKKGNRHCSLSDSDRAKNRTKSKVRAKFGKRFINRPFVSLPDSC